jgi:hypothetical protein
MINIITTRDQAYPPVSILVKDGVHPRFFSKPSKRAGRVVRFASIADGRIESIGYTVPESYIGRLNRGNKGISICKVLHTWFEAGGSVFSGIFTLTPLNRKSISFSTLGGKEKTVNELGLAPCLRQPFKHVNGCHSSGNAQTGALSSSSTQPMRRRWRSNRIGFRSRRTVGAGGRREFAVVESRGLQFAAGAGTSVVTTDSV